MSRTTLPFIIALVLFALSSAGYVFAYQSMSNESAEAIDLQGQIRTKSAETTRAAEARGQLEKIAEDESVVNVHQVAPSDIVSFLTALQNAGAGVGSTVTVNSVAADPASKAAPRLTLMLSIAGSFEAVSRTLGSIEYGPYDTQLTSLTVASAPVASSTAWSANATLSVGMLNASSTKP